MNTYASEFPQLTPLGLYASKTIGDGNCLFNALSDQLYGTQGRNHELRGQTVQYMRENPDDFKYFVSTYSDGGVRRNPKRKAVKPHAPDNDFLGLTPEQIDKNYEAHLKRMSEGGTWGDHIEVQAFAAAYAVDVKIYTKDVAYLLAGRTGDGTEQSTCHIAYHVCNILVLLFCEERSH